MRVNIFRIGRWLSGGIVGIWLAGCIRDAIFLDILSAAWSIVLMAFGFTLAGVAVIIAVAWGIGRVVRRVLGVPLGRDFRPNNQGQVF